MNRREAVVTAENVALRTRMYAAAPVATAIASARRYDAVYPVSGDELARMRAAYRAAANTVSVPPFVAAAPATPLTCGCPSHKRSSVAGLDGFRS